MSGEMFEMSETASSPFRVIVTGDRHWYAPGLAERTVSRLVARYGPNIVMRHGKCRGIDESFEEACEAVGVEHEPHDAEKFGRWPSCGPKRNTHMVKLGAELCLGVHRNLIASRGTKDCMEKAIAAGIPTWLIKDDSGEPERLREGDARLQR